LVQNYKSPKISRKSVRNSKNSVTHKTQNILARFMSSRLWVEDFPHRQTVTYKRANWKHFCLSDVRCISQEIPCRNFFNKKIWSWVRTQIFFQNFWFFHMICHFPKENLDEGANLKKSNVGPGPERKFLYCQNWWGEKFFWWFYGLFWAISMAHVLIHKKGIINEFLKEKFYAENTNIIFFGFKARI